MPQAPIMLTFPWPGDFLFADHHWSPSGCPARQNHQVTGHELLVGSLIKVFWPLKSITVHFAANGVHNSAAREVHSEPILTASLPQPVKFMGWKVHVHACKHYIFWSCNIYLQCYAFWRNSLQIPMPKKKKKKKKGWRVWDFTLLLVVFKWHHGSERVNIIISYETRAQEPFAHLLQHCK